MPIFINHYAHPPYTVSFLLIAAAIIEDRGQVEISMIMKQ